MPTFGPVLVQNPRTKMGVPVTTGIATDYLSGDPVPTFDVDGNPKSVTTDSRGYAFQWEANPPSGVLRLDFGGVVLHVISMSAIVGLSARVTALEARVAALEAGGGGPVELVVTSLDGVLSTVSSLVLDDGNGVLSTTSPAVSDNDDDTLSVA